MNWYFLALFVLAFAAISHQLSGILQNLQSIAAMKRRQLSLQGVEWEVAAEPSDAVKDLAKVPGSEIAAIRAYRQQTGLGIKEARAVILSLRRG